MLLYRPVFRDVEHMSKPANLAEAQGMIDIETPAGEKLAIDDPKLIDNLRKGIRDRHELTLLRSDRAMTDSCPISLFSIQTAQQLSAEVGANLDKRRFRANIYLDLGSASGFAEDQFVGHTLRIGDQVVVAVIDHDRRCKMITLDPDTAQANPEIMRRVARGHDGKAGVYCVVLVEGIIGSGDQIQLLQ
jgi:hypothetical protein